MHSHLKYTCLTKKTGLIRWYCHVTWVVFQVLIQQLVTVNRAGPSSIDSDTSSIFFYTKLWWNIFSGEAELDNEGEILQDSILNSTNHHSDVSNNFNIDHGMGKRGQENIDLNFLENVKGSFFEADNIFAVIPDRIPDTISSNSSNNIFNQMMTKEKSVKLNGSVYGDYVSFPSGQQAADMDLFDHLWGDLENL